jgi:hypothetical protein
VRRDHLGDLRMDAKIILNWYEGVDWINMAQDRIQSRAPVSIVINLQVP